MLGTLCHRPTLSLWLYADSACKGEKPVKEQAARVVRTAAVSFGHVRVGLAKEAYGYSSRRSGRPPAEEGREPPRADVRLARVDHRVGVALRRPLRLTDRGPSCDNRLGSRRPGDAATGAGARRAQEHVPGGGGFGPLSPLLLREHRGVPLGAGPGRLTLDSRSLTLRMPEFSQVQRWREEWCPQG